MSTLVRWSAVVAGLFYVAAGGASSKDIAAPVAKDAVEALLSRLDGIAHDSEMTTAKKAVVASEEIGTFNQQHKGQSLTVRLKIQDVVPYGEGYYVTANTPDLTLVQFPTGKFHVNLSKTEVLSVNKECVLAITGIASAAVQPPVRARSSILEPGSIVAFPLRASTSCWICLENVSYRVETVTTVPETLKPGVLSAEDLSILEPAGLPKRTASKVALLDKTKTDQTRNVDDIKSFFLKGIASDQHSYGSKKTVPMAKTGSGSVSGPAAGAAVTAGTGSRSGAARGRHNRIYSKEELIHKFGNPSSTTSVMSEETWTYKCRDGVVRVHFRQLGYGGNSSSTAPEKVKLEIKSVDSSSTLPKHDVR